MSRIRPGDVLLEMGGQSLSRIGDLRQAIERLPHGEPVAVQIRRGERTLFVGLTVPAESGSG